MYELLVFVSFVSLCFAESSSQIHDKISLLLFLDNVFRRRFLEESSPYYLPSFDISFFLLFHSTSCISITHRAEIQILLLKYSPQWQEPLSIEQLVITQSLEPSKASPLDYNPYYAHRQIHILQGHAVYSISKQHWYKEAQPN